MSEMTTMEVRQEAPARAPQERSERSADWPLAAVFFGSVLALYAVVVYVLYVVFF